MAKGRPQPEITWKYQKSDENDFDSFLPIDVTTEGGKLKISSIKIEDKGIYRCVAANMIGEDYRDVSVKVQCKKYSYLIVEQNL